MYYYRTADGSKIPYEKAGTGQTIVLLPGWTMPRSMFRHQLSGLSDIFEVIALDQRGQSDADKHQVEKISHEVWARDLRDFLLQNNLTDIILVGWSMGAWEAWSYFDQFGNDRISKLVIVEMVAELGEPGWADEENETMAQDYESFMKTFVEGMFVEIDDHVREEITKEVLKTPLKVAQSLQTVQELGNLTNALPKVGVPTLVIFGAESPFFTDEQRNYVRQAHSDATLSIFENSAHCPFWEEAEKFNALVKSFVLGSDYLKDPSSESVQARPPGNPKGANVKTELESTTEQEVTATEKTPRIAAEGDSDLSKDVQSKNTEKAADHKPETTKDNSKT